MPLLDQIQKDMVAAMKGREEARLSALRLIKTALKKHEIDSMKPLDEPVELQLLSTLMKQRREAADMFRKGGRPELADREEAELKLIESYMPSAPTEAEIEAAIAAAMAETGVTLGQANGRGDEGRTGKADRQASGRESVERSGAGQTKLTN